MEIALLIVNTLLIIGLIMMSMEKIRINSPKGILIDTSVLMDGRITDIVNSGFLNTSLIIPQFVIGELQRLADGSDHLRRERARFGLDNIKLLQDSRMVDVVITKRLMNSTLPVDNRLVRIAKTKKNRLLTTDFNLMKVAEIDSVETININQLAQALKPAALPGEEVSVQIVQRGSGKDQGVGYLDDGTMVVVAHGLRHMKKQVTVTITRSLQTVAGRLLFAEPVNHQNADNHSPARG